MTVTIHYRAPNTVNGNPQRVYVVYSGVRGIIAVYDEGYANWIEKKEHRIIIDAVDVSVKEYKRFIATGKKIEEAKK